MQQHIGCMPPRVMLSPAHRHAVAVARVDPADGRDGHQAMAEVGKKIDSVPVTEHIEFGVRAALQEISCNACAAAGEAGQCGCPLRWCTDRGTCGAAGAPNSALQQHGPLCTHLHEAVLQVAAPHIVARQEPRSGCARRRLRPPPAGCQLCTKGILAEQGALPHLWQWDAALEHLVHCICSPVQKLLGRAERPALLCLVHPAGAAWEAAVLADLKRVQ